MILLGGVMLASLYRSGAAAAGAQPLGGTG